MSDPLIMQRKDGESDADFASRIAQMLQKTGAETAESPDDEQY